MESAERTRDHHIGGRRDTAVMMLRSPGNGSQEDRMLRLWLKKTTLQTGTHNPSKHQAADRLPTQENSLKM